MKLNWENNWLRMVGDAEHFSLEGRIFHANCIAIILAVFFTAVYNYVTALHYAVLISIVILLVQIGLFGLSRLKGKTKLAVRLSVIQINTAITVAYFYNAGAEGSIMLLFVLSLFLIFLIIPRKKLTVWYFFNLLSVFALLGIEYFYPNSIQQHYFSRAEGFIDIAFTYLLVSVMIAVGTIQLRRSYRAQKEKAEEKAVKLELMNQEKDKLFSIIAHDLSTPLNSLQQYLQLLNEMELSAQERLDVERNLATSLSDAQYLLGNLLEWAKKQLHNAPMNLKPMVLHTQVWPTLRMFEQVASRKNITLVVDIDKDATILADKNMFDLVLRNLLNNAIKFTNLNGKIWVNTIVDKNHCVLVIKDDGIGISQERQDKIFSLNIASSYGTMNEKGTGLGLLLCKDFIIQQGGDIWFTSAANEGTTFYVKMRLAQ
ncbi:sensor histidine kinase KdpD [Pedobacter sp. ok626]|uniref:sensor histidine kinase n=1 Tax=Pedobacter sp. ok626 TaxID=1761882 RepID=UPI001404FF19|nr:HAMP domain-containing sensor histidine kinase [Pedobacter sp. ok626]